MRQLLLLTLIVILIGCKPGSKEKTGNEVNNDSSVITAPPKDSGTSTQPEPTSQTGKIDIESFGDLKLAQHYKETIKAIGNPDSKSKAVEWGADGLLHEDWTWAGKGLVLNMSSDKTNVESSLSIFSITAKSPCSFKTKAGVGIGSSYTEVQEAYKKDIDAEATDKTQITVGSVYGGIIFTFKDDKVTSIFLGAAAE